MTACTAAAVQLSIVPVYDTSGGFVPEARAANLARLCGHVENLRANLVVFPEFSLQGFSTGATLQGQIDAAIDVPGLETDRISAAAQQAGSYVSFCTYERIAQFPGRFFNSNVVVGPTGDVELVYRKLYAMTTKTRPGDVLTQWLDAFGRESLFPTLATKFGRLGSLVAGDMMWPETARCLALKGAEIIVNPLAAGESRTKGTGGADWVRPVRAFENQVFVVAANFGPLLGSRIGATRAPSEIIDYQGNFLARSDTAEETIICADLDIAALRRYRMTQKKNLLAQFQPHLHRLEYDDADLFPADGWAQNPIADNEENWALERRVAKKMIARGIITPPSS